MKVPERNAEEKQPTPPKGEINPSPVAEFTEREEFTQELRGAIRKMTGKNKTNNIASESNTD